MAYELGVTIIDQRQSLNTRNASWSWSAIENGHLFGHYSLTEMDCYPFGCSTSIHRENITDGKNLAFWIQSTHRSFLVYVPLFSL